MTVATFNANSFAADLPRLRCVPQGYRIRLRQNRGRVQKSTDMAQSFNRSGQILATLELGRSGEVGSVALGLLFVIVTALITMTGYFVPSAGITFAQAADGIPSLFLMLAASSLDEFHHSGRWKAIACRQ